jgi:hypothetical protein
MNIVLCFDGTGDWVGSDYTNVAKIFNSLDRSNQLCYYDGGVGTLTDARALSTLSRTWLKLVDLGTATGMRDKVLGGYTFLCRNYKKGDKIFLFGFSRGAYTARLVAAMVKNFGLLCPENENVAPYLWQTIAAFTNIKQFEIAAARIRRDFARHDLTPDIEVDSKIRIYPAIDFMGLFDTVSSVGVVGRFKTYPNTDHNDNVLRTCHAVAIDEERNCFPESLMHPAQRGLTEVWFPGVHRDSGGGVDPKMARIADEALHWVQVEADRCKLVFTKMEKPDESQTPIPNFSKSDPYAFVGFYPMKMFSKAVSAYRFLWPDFRHTRLIPEYALIHAVACEMQADKNTAYDPVNWPEKMTCFHTGDNFTSPTRYILRKLPKLPEAVGTVVGVAALFLVWNSLLASPFGLSWPTQGSAGMLSHLLFNFGYKDWLLTPGWNGGSNAAWAAGIIFIIFFLCQFIGQKPAQALPATLRPRSTNLLSFAGIVVVLAIVFSNPGWILLQLGLTCGLLFSLVSQWFPLPTITADRVMPRVAAVCLVSALCYALILWVPWLAIPDSSRATVITIIALICSVVAFARLGSDRVAMKNEELLSAAEVGDAETKHAAATALNQARTMLGVNEPANTSQKSTNVKA